MAEIDESWLVPDTAAEAPLRKFAPDEMVTCAACLRANAPTRAQCLYCGASLNQPAATMTGETAAVEETDANKHYVVVRAREGQLIDDADVAQLAAKFHLKPEELGVALRTDAPLPLTSTPSKDETTKLISEMTGAGIESASIAFADLKTDIAHVNIRTLEFADDAVIAMSKSGGQRYVSKLTDLQLIVPGRLLMHRLEVDERRSRTSVKPLDRRELTDDQAVIDMYTQPSDAPWRVIANDFDFSCLGELKGLTAFDNVKALIDLLKDRTPAEVNDSYLRLKPILTVIWPAQNTTSQSRSRRPRAGRHDFSTVTSSDNETQFNNYSRLVWCWKRRNSTARP